MTEPAAAPLFGDEALPAGRRGVASDHLERAITAARERKQLEGTDEALVGEARVAAFALDQAMHGSGPKVAYAVASVLTPYREILERLGLAPVPADGTPVAGGAAAFLADLAAPTFEPPPTP